MGNVWNLITNLVRISIQKSDFSTRNFYDILTNSLSLCGGIYNKLTESKWLIRLDCLEPLTDLKDSMNEVWGCVEFSLNAFWLAKKRSRKSEELVSQISPN